MVASNLDASLNTTTSPIINPSPIINQPQQFCKTNQINSNSNLISFNNNTITINSNKQPANFNCQPSNVAFLEHANGISRVMNLKPKKSTIYIKKTSLVNSNSNNLKGNGITITGNNHLNQQINDLQKERNKMNNKNYCINGNSIGQINKFSSNNKNYMQCNNVNSFMPSHQSNNSFLTLKITGNGLQSNYRY